MKKDLNLIVYFGMVLTLMFQWDVQIGLSAEGSTGRIPWMKLNAQKKIFNRLKINRLNVWVFPNVHTVH